MSIFSELWYTERYTAETANLDRFSNRYFEMKRYDAAQRAADARRFNKYSGPTSLPFESEPRSRIRERALTKTLERVRDPSFLQGALEPERTGALSRDSRLLQSRLGLRIGAERRLERQLRQVREQDAAADADERAFARASPLQQAKRRDGWFRVSDLDRRAAIAGLLQRERRQASPLTREAYGRAKSIDAARGTLDPFVVTDADLERAASGVQTSLAYDAFVLTEKRRRETLFAKREIISGGYPGPRGPSKAKLLARGC